MADLTTDFFIEANERVKVLFQRGRDLVEAELNESQDIARVLRRRTFASIFGHGFISTAYKILPSGNANEILIEAGNALIQGEHLENPSQFPVQNLTTPGVDRQDIVYLKVREIEIDSVTDPTILLPDIGETARRVKLEWEVIVDEGSVVLPTTTGDIHDGGIHYELIGYLFRLAATPVITTAQISDNRTIIGFVFLNEDKNLEVVGGGDVAYASGTGQVSFTAPIRIIQPSTAGHALVQLTESSFFLPLDGDAAYVVLNRSASANYDVNIQIGTWNAIPNNANAYPLFYRSDDSKLYAVEGTVWADGQTHPMRQNPFTGLIVDADVSPTADIQGTKLLDFSVPLTKLVSIPEGVPANGIILWGDSGTCPTGFTKLEIGTNDTYIRVAGTGGVPNLTPTGLNTHGHGSHTHSDGTYTTPIVVHNSTLFLNTGGSQDTGGFAWDSFPTSTNPSGIPGNNATINFSLSGTSGATTIATASHEPKHIQLVLCKKDP